jgi:hypothetical protein
MAAGCKESPLVSLQKLNPAGDVASIPNVTVKSKFCTQERRTQLRNEFLSRVVARAKSVLQIPIKARPMSRPVPIMPISA